MVRRPAVVVGWWCNRGLKTLMRIREFPNSPLPLPPPHRLQQRSSAAPSPFHHAFNRRLRRSPYPSTESTKKSKHKKSKITEPPTLRPEIPEPEIPDSGLKKKRSKIEPDDGEIVETAETPSEKKSRKNKKRKASDDKERSDTVSDAEEPVEAEVKVKVLAAKVPEPNGNGPLLKKQKVHEKEDAGWVDSARRHSVGNDGIEGVMPRDLERVLLQEQSARASVYADLEKERSAAANAADEAMVMILCLQEEKATVEIEARQFWRMVEEKSAYDEEEMGILKEIVMRREIEGDMKLMGASGLLEDLVLMMHQIYESLGENAAEGIKMEGSWFSSGKQVCAAAGFGDAVNDDGIKQAQSFEKNSILVFGALCSDLDLFCHLVLCTQFQNC